MDPSLIDKYQSVPEVRYMIDKIEACKQKLRERGIEPSQPFQGPSVPVDIQSYMRSH